MMSRICCVCISAGMQTLNRPQAVHVRLQVDLSFSSFASCLHSGLCGFWSLSAAVHCGRRRHPQTSQACWCVASAQMAATLWPAPTTATSMPGSGTLHLQQTKAKPRPSRASTMWFQSRMQLGIWSQLQLWTCRLLTGQILRKCVAWAAMSMMCCFCSSVMTGSPLLQDPRMAQCG